MRTQREYDGEVSTDDGDGPATETRRFDGLSRRSLLVGMAGAAGLAGAGLPSVAAASERVDPDPHTRQTFRALVDAVVPRTPELGDEQAPGALDVELENYLIWSIDHGTEQPHRRELAPGRGRGNGNGRGRGSTFHENRRGRGNKPGSHNGRGRRNGDGSATNPGPALRESLAVDLSADDGGLENLVAALEAELGFSTERDLGMARSDVFGALEGLELKIVGNGDANVSIQSASGDATEKRSTLPLAALYAVVLDLYALVLVLSGSTTGTPRPREKFAGGGFYSFLEPIDRITCLLFTVQEPELLGAIGDVLLPEGTLVGDISSSVLSLAPYGYYSEWAGYGDTKTAPIDDRELQQPVETVQGYRQVDYPGPADGYAGFHGYPIESFTENDWEGDQ